MLEFLKQFFNKQDRELTFVIFDDREPEPSSSYRFRPAKLLYLFYGSLLFVALLMFVLLKFTPVGGLFFSESGQELRAQAIKISKQVRALQDSLHARNAQLAQMKEVIVTGKDTTLPVNSITTNTPNTAEQKSSEPESLSAVSMNSDTILTANELVRYDVFRDHPVFPSVYPLEGILTRGFNPQRGHFGIDIATKEGTPFRAIADGVIVNQSWTLNYGWVLHVQHGNGIITIYKHAKNLSKSIGDIVSKGDILGTAGDTGIMSSGPHLHLEIWKNGVPQNPNSYLIKS